MPKMGLKLDFLAGQVTWAPHFISLCLGFLIGKTEVINVPNKSAFIIEISHLICVKLLEQC